MARSWVVDENGNGSWQETGPFSAVDLMENLLQSATGISGLGPWAAGLYNAGAEPTEIVSALRYGTDTSPAGKQAYQAYLAAFPKMDKFIREGIFPGENPELQYIQYRNAVTEAAQRFGVNPGLVSKDRIADYIEGKNSAAELVDRMGQAAAAVATTPPETISVLRDYYNVKNSDLMSFYLDTQNTEDMLKKQYTAARIGTEAVRNQFGISRQEAENLAERGVTMQEAEQGFQTIAGQQGFMAGAGETATRGELLGGTFGSQQEAEKVARIGASRAGRFQAGGELGTTKQGVAALGSSST